MYTKEPIRLRRRKLATGITSLYLDIYINGNRSYEYLKLYLIPEKSRNDKNKNMETLRLAEAIKAKRIVAYQNGEFGFSDAGNNNIKFFDYFEKCCENRLVWNATLVHLKLYEKNHNITFKNITREWVQGFYEYLKHARNHKCSKYKQITPNTQLMYITKLKACLNKAIKQQIITRDPSIGIDKIKGEETTRMYLTIDEIRKLSSTKCSNIEVKKAFLFSCLTGLRHSDIMKLKWEDVKQEGNFTRIIFRQQKTKGQEYLDINNQAAEIMGERKDHDKNIFTPPKTVAAQLIHLVRWVKNANINKKITFHCARHTFAVMMLDLGTDIYTVSKLLGHREISTTQIYAKVLDKNKQKAIANIPSIF